MKYHQMFLMVILAIFGLSVICGCATLAPKKIEYPEVPEDYPFSVVWLRPKEETAQLSLNVLNQLELLNQVMIKKWNEGDHDFVGGDIGENGKVYLHYPDVVYVEWDEGERPDGTIVKYPAKIGGPGGDSDIVEQVSNGILPPGVQVLDMDSSGIDPYEFLSQ